MIKILSLAILIRLLIMPFYFHPDIKTFNFQSSFLKQGVYDIYSHLVESREKLPLKEEFVYFPLTYFFLGGYQFLISPLLGEGFSDWLYDASQTASERVGVYKYLFLLKLLYLFFDIALGLLLMQFFKTPQQKKKALLFWLFNPFSILLIYGFSNIDIVPTFISFASVLLFLRKKIVLSALLIGVAAGFKAYPLLFIPFFLIYANTFKQRILILLVSLGSFFVIIAPFISKQAFIQSTMVSGLTTRIFFPSFGIGFGETLMLPVLASVALFFFGLLKENKKDEDIWKYLLALLLLIFSFIHYHIQWLVWIMPFLIMLIIHKVKLTSVVVILLTVAFLIPFLYQDKSMTVGVLSAISPLYNLIPTPYTVTQRIFDPILLQGILHSILAGGSIVLIWKFLVRSEQ